MISDDEPIPSVAEDRLGRAPVAARIVDIVARRSTSAPLVLALHGPWGSGKSSVLAMVQAALNQAGVVSVPFEPWLFNDIEELIRSFFATVFEALLKGGAKARKLRKLFERFGVMMTAASKLAGRDFDFTAEQQTPTELRDEIRAVSTELGKRIVVIVDDVDRLPLEELALVLKLVRLCGNLPHFTYLLAYDRRVVSASLRELYKGDSDFLDKIVQVEIPLPPVPPKLLADYVCDGLLQLGTATGVDMAKVVEIFEERDDETRHLLAPMSDGDDPRLLVRTLRDAKRLLNGLGCTLPLVSHEVDLVDFAHVELIRIFFPSLYDDLYVHRFSLATFDNNSIAGDDRRQKRQALHREMATEILKLPHGAVALRIVSALFPVFSASVQSPTQHYGPRAAWQRDMKASDPAHIEKYFQLRVSLDAVPRKVVRDAIDAVNAPATALEGRSAMVVVLKQQCEAKRLRSFLDGVYLEAERIDPTRVETVLEAIAAVAPIVSDRPKQEREASSLAIATLRLAKRLGTDASGPVMEGLVTSGHPIYALELLLYAAAGADERPDPSIPLDRMRSAFVARLRARLAVPEVDVFTEYADDWVEVLKVWNEPDEVDRYLARLMAAKPGHWRELASATLWRRHEARTMSLEVLRQLATLSGLAEAARHLDLNEAVSEDPRTLEALASELNLVPDLLRELELVKECGAVIAEIDQVGEPTMDWSTPAWTRARPRLEPVHAQAPWWQRLVSLFETFLGMRERVESLGILSDPSDLPPALATAESLRHEGGVLVAEIEAVIGPLRQAIGTQTPLPFPDTNNNPPDRSARPRTLTS